MTNHRLIPRWTFAACCLLAGALLPVRAEAQAQLLAADEEGRAAQAVGTVVVR